MSTENRSSAYTSRTQGSMQAGGSAVRLGAGSHGSREETAFQPKLTVNEPGDKYEKEAERVADAVMRMSDDGTGNRMENRPENRIQRMCPRCRRRHRQGKPLDCEECEQELQRKRDETGGDEGPPAQQAAEATRGSGQPLPNRTQSFFEDRMGADFSDVRVHTGGKADRAARSINARAYTLGSDVVMRSGEYRPHSREGKRLLAHELTHVVQQDPGVEHIARQDAGHPVDGGPPRDAGSPERDGTREDRDTEVPAGTSNQTTTTADAGQTQAGDTGGQEMTVSVNSADITGEEVTVNLEGSQEAGMLTVELTGPNSHQLLKEERSAGTHSVQFDLTTLPNREYTGVRATWSVGEKVARENHEMDNVRVLGTYRHSQYNIPSESSCGGTDETAYIVSTDEGTCNFTETEMSSDFIEQVNLNGSGRSEDHGPITRDPWCVNNANDPPADAENRSFRDIDQFSGACGEELDTDTVAVHEEHNYLACNDDIYINTVGEKTVTDYCPGCDTYSDDVDGQIDNFTDEEGCGGDITDLGDYVTVKI